MRPRPFLLPLFLALAGCGGGGSSHSDAGLSNIVIDWPATTRSFAGSPIAGSALVVFTTTATTPQTVATFTVVRPSESGEVQKSYTLPTKVAMGSYFLTVRFCKGSDADLANEVGVGATAVTVAPNGVLQGSDGQSLGDIAFANALTNLTLVVGQKVSVDEKKSLMVQAKSPDVDSDHSGNVITIPFSQVALTSSDPSVLIANEDGTVTGVKVGTANVTVKAFGLTGTAVAVSVTSP